MPRRIVRVRVPRACAAGARTAEQATANLAAGALPPFSSAGLEEVQGIYDTTVKRIVEAEKW